MHSQTGWLSLGEKAVNDRRTIALQKILQHELDGDVERARQLRRDQAGDASSVPSDEADIARSELDRNMLMNLAERSEERLKAIEGAFERLERGSYGEMRAVRRRNSYRTAPSIAVRVLLRRMPTEA
jgi:predicted transcriptional regulator of viral defense system